MNTSVRVLTLDTPISILFQTFELATTSSEIEDIIRRGKIASLIGVEGYVTLVDTR